MYAEAINAAIKQQVQQLIDFGGLLAQADLPMPTNHSEQDLVHIQQGYDDQLAEYPFG